MQADVVDVEFRTVCFRSHAESFRCMSEPGHTGQKPSTVLGAAKRHRDVEAHA
jgi:hypothetical protein